MAQRTSATATATEESLLEKLIRTKYPLTNYLHRQQQFAKTFSSTTETTKVTKHRVMQPKPSFNVPDTLDPFASEYEQQHSHDQDETILSSSDYRPSLSFDLFSSPIDLDLSHCIPESQSAHLSNIVQRSSSIQLEFSPMESELNSPLRRAIENGLNLLNK